MLVRSLRAVQGTNTGIDRDHLLIVDVDAQTRGYQGARLSNLAHELRDRIQAMSGVAGVSFSENGLFSGNDSRTSFELPGFTMRSKSDSIINYDVVGPSFVSTMGGRMITGREFTAADEAGLPREGILNQAAAEFLFPGESAIGKYLHFSDSVAVRIIGVTADVRDQSLRAEPARRLYLSYVHADDPQNFGPPGALNLVVRTAGDPALAMTAVRRAIQAVDPSLPINGLAPLTTLMRQSIREERMVARLATIFGALALLLAAIGLYGVMNYAVSRRTGEIGLRVALGAQTSDVIGMVLRQGLTMVAVGLGVGLPLAVVGMRVLRAQSTAAGPIDVSAIAVAVLVLAASAVVAVLVPARRASRVAPGIALKAD
jgi:predicted permease